MSKNPTSIGIILDGNRRWAKERGLPASAGHKQGGEKVKELLSWAHEAGVKEVVFYAFSTENWNRDPKEVEHLMALFESECAALTKEADKRNIRVRFIGEKERFSESIQRLIDTCEQETKENTAGVLWIAFSYGGRAEILAGVNALLKSNATEVTEDTFKSALWSAGMTDPELIIRTGGEKRLSNFLTWQSVYSELYFTDTKLPDLTKEEFLSILQEYTGRQRRHGK